MGPCILRTPSQTDGLRLSQSSGKQRWVEAALVQHVFLIVAGDLEKGRQARKDIVKKYSPESVARLMLFRLSQIEKIVETRRVGSTQKLLYY